MVLVVDYVEVSTENQGRTTVEGTRRMIRAVLKASHPLATLPTPRVC